MPRLLVHRLAHAGETGLYGIAEAVAFTSIARAEMRWEFKERHRANVNPARTAPLSDAMTETVSTWTQRTVERIRQKARRSIV